MLCHKVPALPRSQPRENARFACRGHLSGRAVAGAWRRIPVVGFGAPLAKPFFMIFVA